MPGEDKAQKTLVMIFKYLQGCHEKEQVHFGWKQSQSTGCDPQLATHQVRGLQTIYLASPRHMVLSEYGCNSVSGPTCSLVLSSLYDSVD